MSATVRVAVVGGGITGLAAALRLSERLGDGFVLLEADGRLGGKITTERTNGFVIEGGPDCFLAGRPGGMALCRMLGLEPRLMGTNPVLRRTYVKRRGRLHELPAGLSGLVPSRIGPLLTAGLLSPLGRVRAGLELLVRARHSAEDESIAEFVIRRFGAEAYHWLVEPLLSGIYAGDGTRLSLEATFPQLSQLERDHGSVVGAMIRSRTGPRSAVQGPGFVTMRGGLGEIVAAIAARLPTTALRTNAAVVAISQTAAGYRLSLAGGEELQATQVVLATPAFAAAELLRPLSPELATELQAIPYVTTATVSLAYAAVHVPRPLDGYGYVSPRAEGGPVVACTWTSNKFPDRAPAGDVLVRLFVGREGQEEIVDADDATLLGVAREELARLFGLTTEPSLTRVVRWPKGIPQYHVGHRSRLDRIDRLLSRLPGLQLAGSAYRGVGLPDCVTQGWDAVDRALGATRAAA